MLQKNIVKHLFFKHSEHGKTKFKQHELET